MNCVTLICTLVPTYLPLCGTTLVESFCFFLFFSCGANESCSFLFDEQPYGIAFELRIYYVHTLIFAYFARAHYFCHAPILCLALSMPCLLVRSLFLSLLLFMTDTTALHIGRSMRRVKLSHKTCTLYIEYNRLSAHNGLEDFTEIDKLLGLSAILI